MADVILLYGDPDSGKTTQLGRIAEYIARKTGKKSLLYSADGGGWKPIQDLVDSGLIIPKDVTLEPKMLFLMRRLLAGDYLSEKGGARRWIPKDKFPWEKIGAVLIEGTTSISEGLMRHISMQDAKIGTEELANKYIERWDDENIESSMQEQFGSNSRGHYHEVQKFVQECILRSKRLPVDMVAWTGHVGQGEDESSKDTKYGPQLAGSKKNITIIKDFGEAFHLAKQKVKVKRGEEINVEDWVFAYYRSHEDRRTGFEYVCKSKMPLAGLGSLEERFPGGRIRLTGEEGIEKYFEFQTEWLTERKKKLAESVGGK